MTVDEALEVLARGAFAPFVGAAESQALEFKREPYPLDNERQRFELPKDAAGLANAAGGVIVIGLETHGPDDASPVDIVREVRELTAGSIDAHRYIAIIERCTFPRIKGLRIKFFTGEVARRLPAARFRDGSVRRDVLVQAEEVRRIVGSLERSQPLVLLGTVGLPGMACRGHPASTPSSPALPTATAAV